MSCALGQNDTISFHFSELERITFTPAGNLISFRIGKLGCLFFSSFWQKTPGHRRGYAADVTCSLAEGPLKRGSGDDASLNGTAHTHRGAMGLTLPDL